MQVIPNYQVLYLHPEVTNTLEPFAAIVSFEFDLNAVKLQTDVQWNDFHEQKLTFCAKGSLHKKLQISHGKSSQWDFMYV